VPEKRSWWRRLFQPLNGTRRAQEEPSEFEKLKAEIEVARQEWAMAQRHLDYVSDTDLIDQAIYYLEAAEIKYGFLLREAKKRYAEEFAQQDPMAEVVKPFL
jgi:hypothetical protein